MTKKKSEQKTPQRKMEVQVISYGEHNQRQFMIENYHAVDVVVSLPELLEHVMRGWRFIADCTGDSSLTIYNKAHEYAAEHKKVCCISKPMTREEYAAAVSQFYTAVLGKEFLQFVAEVYAQDRDMAVSYIHQAMTLQSERDQSALEKYWHPKPKKPLAQAVKLGFKKKET